ncbi:MAG: hypothetical protein ACE5JM_13455 [Armatimonadota bacterium]
MAFLNALFALPMSEADLQCFRQCTGRTTPPPDETDEAAAIVGRRGGKSQVAALIATYLATLRDWRPFLGPGERAHVVVIAQSLRAGRVPLGYIRAFFRDVPTLRQEIMAERADELDLRNGVTIGVWPCTYRSTRGLTIAAAVLDEVDFWWQESINAAEEVVASIRPAMASLPHPKLIAISSPYTPTGWLHKFHREHWARDDGAVVWKAPSVLMNPTLNPARIAAAIAEDPERGRAEWEAEWRAGVSALLDPVLVDRCVRAGPLVIPPTEGNLYMSAVDPSGGGADEFTWSVAHLEGGRVVVDLITARGRRGRQALDLDAVVAECAADLTRYGLTTCLGDKYAAGWVVEAFRRHGILYVHSDRPKSDHYLNLLPLVTMGRLELPDDVELLRQAKLLERRQGAQGKDSVDHPRAGHDDRINAVALATSAAVTVGQAATVSAEPSPQELAFLRSWAHEVGWTVAAGLRDPNIVTEDDDDDRYPTWIV